MNQPSKQAAKRRRSRLKKINWLGIGFIVVLLALWELADRLGAIKAEFLPRPSSIFEAAGYLIANNELLGNVGHTVGVTLLGWVIASCSGLVIGSLLGLFRPAWTYGMTTVELFRALPSIVLLPISVLLFGFSVEMELVLIVFSAQWPVMIATIDGVRLVPQSLRDAGMTLQLSRWNVIRKIVIPSALPSILVGLRLALALSLILAIAAEMLGNPSGMGNALVSEQEALQPDRMFVYFLAIGFLGILLNFIFIWLSRLAAPGHSARAERTRL